MCTPLLQFGLAAAFTLGLTIQTHGQPTLSPTQRVADTSQSANSTTQPTVGTSVSAQRIGYRLKDWKTIHSHDLETALSDVETLQKLGCEVTSNDHGNHVDVRYRCVDWKIMELSQDVLVEQWSTWLSAKGIETVIANPPESTTQPTVKFRLASARTMHLHNPTEASQILNTMKMIGVQVTSKSHGDHQDATVSCPDWKTIGLVSEGQAHVWQEWLKKSGFETKHTH